MPPPEPPAKRVIGRQHSTIELPGRCVIVSLGVVYESVSRVGCEVVWMLFGGGCDVEWNPLNTWIYIVFPILDTVTVTELVGLPLYGLYGFSRLLSVNLLSIILGVSVLFQQEEL